MSLGRPVAVGFDDDDDEAIRAPADAGVRVRSRGRRRVVVAAALLVVVLAVLILGGPVALQSQGRPVAIFPGLTVEEGTHPKGLVVTSVQSNSIADDVGVLVGDTIIGLDAHPVSTRADARRYLGQRHPVVVEMKLARAGRPVEVVFVFPKRSGR